MAGGGKEDDETAGELVTIGEIDPNLMKEAEESEQRFDFLTKQLTDLEKASSDLKEMIRDLDKRIHEDFKSIPCYQRRINNYFRLMFSTEKPSCFWKRRKRRF